MYQSHSLFDSVFIVNLGFNHNEELIPYLTYRFPNKDNNNNNENKNENQKPLSLSSRGADWRRSLPSQTQRSRTTSLRSLTRNQPQQNDNHTGRSSIESDNSISCADDSSISNAPVFRIPKPSESSAEHRSKKIISEQDPFVKSIMEFCFPDLDNISPFTLMQSEIFTFVLTNAGGERTFGYCKRALPQGNGLRYPQCFCILSFLPCFRIFSQILQIVELRCQVSDERVTEFLTAILAEPCPQPGETIQFQCRAVYGTLPEPHRFTRTAESDRLVETLHFGHLLKHVSSMNILKLFASILCERRIIFTCKNVTTLSAVIRSFVGILYPFRWPHIYVPVLPRTMMNFCCAPMPFILGVLSVHLTEVLKLQSAMEEVTLFDIDQNRFSWRPFEDELTLPHRYLTSMSYKISSKNPFKRSILNQISSKLITLEELNIEMAEVFLHFFVTLFSEYRSFLTFNQVRSVFQKKDFLEAQSDPDVKKFLSMFLQTQLFECFVREREHLDFAKLREPFEEKIKDFQKENKNSTRKVALVPKR